MCQVWNRLLEVLKECVLNLYSLHMGCCCLLFFAPLHLASEADSIPGRRCRQLCCCCYCLLFFAPLHFASEAVTIPGRRYRRLYWSAWGSFSCIAVCNIR